MGRLGFAFLLALIVWAAGCAPAARPESPELVAGPHSGAAIVGRTLWRVRAPGATRCRWSLEPEAAGSPAEGACALATDASFACDVNPPAPGRYRLTFTAENAAGGAQTTLDHLDYRPRYGGRYPEMDDGSGGIASGWGAWGGNAVAEPVVREYPGQGTVTIYRPEVLPARRPTVFFVSGWGRDAATYEQLFRYVASKGFVLVNVYNENPGDIRNTYPNALAMIEDALARHPDWIDTTRVGLMGHSMGGGMAFWLAVQLYADRGWGASGRFVFVTAPWYTFLTTPADLERVPADTRVLLEAYEEDLATDPDVCGLVFDLLPTPATGKDFVWVRSGTVDGRAYHANHFTSYTGAETQWDPVHYEPYDRLDAYAINRPLDALMALVFDGDAEARTVALGGGAPEQVAMGPLPELVVTDAPDFHDPGVTYDYVCRDGNDEGWDDLDVWMLEEACPVR